MIIITSHIPCYTPTSHSAIPIPIFVFLHNLSSLSHVPQRTYPSYTCTQPPTDHCAPTIHIHSILNPSPFRLFISIITIRFTMTSSITKYHPGVVAGKLPFYPYHILLTNSGFLEWLSR